MVVRWKKKVIINLTKVDEISYKLNCNERNPVKQKPSPVNLRDHRRHPEQVCIHIYGEEGDAVPDG